MKRTMTVEVSTTTLTATWLYSTDDQHKPLWRCSNCGKVCRKDPKDKRFCAWCGAAMKKEA